RATGNEFVRDGVKRTRPQEALGNDVSYTNASYNDSGWRKLTLPHDWGIEGPFVQQLPGETAKLPWSAVGWYRKHFPIAVADKGKQLFLQLDGAMAYSTVWLNGKYVGGWPYGYASYELDLTPYIKFGSENVIAIRLDNPPESSRWYPGGGLYRNVWLVKTAPLHVAHWGTYVTTPNISSTAGTVDLKVTVNNDTASTAIAKVLMRIYALSANGKRLGPALNDGINDLNIPAGGNQTVALVANVPRPKLWSLLSRNLYSVVATIEQNGRVIDEYETIFGF